MNHLLREQAPISDDVWAQIDDDARTRLATYLQGRRLIDFTGPFGWDYSVTNVGDIAAVSDLPDSPASAIEAAVRVVQPLAELRAHFTLARRDLDDASRGNPGINLDTLEAAARAVATCENAAVFHGWPAAGIEGIVPASAHEPVSLDGDYAAAVTTAVTRLAMAGVSGPYGLGLGDNVWVNVLERTERGTTVSEHLSKILGGGPILWVPGITGGVVISQRGQDIELVSGQDFSIGYQSSDAESVTLYFEESFTLKVIDGTAAVALVPTD